MKNRKIVVNKIMCNYCGDMIESESVHDFKWCSCGKVAVDGGHEYLKRMFTVSQGDYIDYSEFEDE